MAILFSEAQIVSAHFFATQQFSPACFPLPVRGIGRDLCKMVITSPPPYRTGDKKRSLGKGSFVRIKGLEPPRRKASDPKSDVATNYTISARYVQRYIKIHKSQSGAGIIRLFYLLL